MVSLQERRVIESEIRENVLEELRLDPRLEITDVEVSELDGIVTLAGVVHDWGSSQVAAQDAREIAGVRRVINHLVVHVPHRVGQVDRELAAAALLSLRWNFVTSASAISVTARGGVVELSGQVRSATERDYATQLVSALVGVRRVENRLLVDLPPRESCEIEAEIRAAIRRHGVMDDLDVEIRVIDGEVDITGFVFCWCEKRTIAGLAARVAGVRRVKDELYVLE
jgi:osmotically-inducible protein OsmY